MEKIKKEHVLGKIGEKNQKWEAANFNIFFADVAEKKPTVLIPITCTCNTS